MERCAAVFIEDYRGTVVLSHRWVANDNWNAIGEALLSTL